MTLVCNVVGARPNFMKIAPIVKELQKRDIPEFLVHTGQHYDEQMSTIFFKELGLPAPDAYLGIGSGSHAEQTARIMIAFEAICMEHKPTLVIVGGDVNSTLACALVAGKLHIPVAHVEAGLRSFDRSMPEEINRVLTDHVASLLFTTEPSGKKNLLKEGILEEVIFFVGNTMIDSLKLHLDKAIDANPWQRFELKPDSYGLITLHRPSNVDNQDSLFEICMALKEISGNIPLLFSVHPRTRKNIEQLQLNLSPIKLVEPLGYLDFLGLMAKARLVLTDSGGIQEETTALGVPCVTIRLNTERPITIEIGTNRLAGNKRDDIINAAHEALSYKKINTKIPQLWDGQAAHRIADVIEQWLDYKAMYSTINNISNHPKPR